jgi:hypothetical protein
VADAEPERQAPQRVIHVYVNEDWTEIPVYDDEPPLFLDMLNFVDIDTKRAKGDLVLAINGNPASYTDPVFDGDKVSIQWRE